MNEAHIWDSCLFATFNFSFNFSPALSLLMIENFPSDEPCQSARFPHHMYSLTDFLLLIDWRLSFQFLLSPPMQTCLAPSHLLISDPLTSSSPSLFLKNRSWWYYFHVGMHEPSKSLFSTQVAHQNVFSSLYLQEHHMNYLHRYPGIL